MAYSEQMISYSYGAHQNALKEASWWAFSFAQKNRIYAIGYSKSKPAGMTEPVTMENQYLYH
jgi:hypothetical protein